YKTSDFGKTWERLTAKLPQDVYLHVVREDPRKQGQLYLGTEHGVMFSADDGKHWKPLKLNMPTVAIHDLAVKGDDLVVGTNGRSIGVLDDLTRGRMLTPEIADKDTSQSPVSPALRYRSSGSGSEVERMDLAKNPPIGAAIHYSLKKKPKGEI